MSLYVTEEWPGVFTKRSFNILNVASVLRTVVVVT